MNFQQFAGLIFPGLTAKYIRSRARLRNAQRLYEASQFTSYRPKRGGKYSGDANMQKAADTLRGLSRYLEENHDLMVGVYDELVNNVVGSAVMVEPMVKLNDGSLDKDVNDQLRELHQDWSRYPEVSGELGRESMDRLVARSCFRDGEIFIQDVFSQRFAFRTPVPYALELIEADWCPFDMVDPERRIVHGIERNGWGATIAVHFLVDNPANQAVVIAPTVGVGETRRVNANRLHHIKFSRRVGQARGVPIVHAAINRLRDVGDYEESERIAAKVSASIALALERDAGVFPGEDIDDSQRELVWESGAIFNLLPGEKISTVGSERPNTGLNDFRNSMMRAIAAGTGTRYSAISRDYGGTYSSQRQELVEATIGYRSLFSYLKRRYFEPVYVNFAERAFLSGQLQLSPGTDLTTLTRAEFRPPALPWIDPLKESQAWALLKKEKLESAAEIARMRGRDPERIREELEQEAELDIYQPVNPIAEPSAADDEQDDDENDERSRVVNFER